MHEKYKIVFEFSFSFQIVESVCVWKSACVCMCGMKVMQNISRSFLVWALLDVNLL